MAAPMMACSEIGVVRTRSWPYLVDRPLVTLTTPPAGLGDVLAEQDHRSASRPMALVERLVDGLDDR